MDKELQQIRKDVDDLGSPDDEIAHCAEIRLAQAGPRAVRQLSKACADPGPAVRRRAVWGLGRTRDKRAFSAITRLLEDPDPDVRYSAVIALGDLGDERAIKPLIDLVRAAADEEVLSAAAGNALAEIGEATVAPLIGALLTGSPDAKVVTAYTLGQIGAPASVEPVGGLTNDPNEWVRLAGIESLARLAELLSPPLAFWCMEFIERCTNDPVERVRESASYWSRELRPQLGELEQIAS